ncbi:hypothetical protein BDW71DRAFT_192707 [Aspergillus fruticulosus]
MTSTSGTYLDDQTELSIQYWQVSRQGNHTKTFKISCYSIYKPFRNHYLIGNSPLLMTSSLKLHTNISTMALLHLYVLVLIACLKISVRQLLNHLVLL